MECQASGANGPSYPLRDGLGVEFTPEQMPSQVQVRLDPQVLLADGDEDRRLRNGVGGEVMQLHLVVVAKRPNEAAGGNAETPLVEPRQADDVAARGASARHLIPARSTPGARDW